MEIPAGQHAPFATVTPQDHSAWILISAAFGLSMILVFAAIRIFIRAWISSGYGVDDYLVGASTAIATLQASLLLKACSMGIGKSQQSLAMSKLQVIQSYYYASNILFIVALALSKASIGSFLLRLSPARLFRKVTTGMLGSLGVWAFAFIFAQAFVCGIPGPWKVFEPRCHASYAVWSAFEWIGCVYELTLVAMSCWLIWDLKTTRASKGTVVVAFSSRLLMAVFVAIRLDSFNQADFDKDPTLYGARFVTWTSAELSYSIISATIPILKPFVNNLSTKYGGGAASSSNGYGSGYAGRSTGSNLRATQNCKAGSQSFRMTRLDRGKDDAMRSSRTEGLSARRNSGSGERSLVQTPNGITDNDGVRPASKDGASVESEGSQKMIIRKDVTWHVERDGMSM